MGNVGMRSRKKTLLLALVLLLVAAPFLFKWGLQWKWRDLLSPAERVAVIGHSPSHQKDTALNVVMIGDSWAGMHHETGCDSVMKRLLEEMMCRPVDFVSKGRGGARSKDVYRLMFKSQCSPGELADGYCTDSLLAERPDYCIVMAGINDASANIGTDYYLANYRLILSWLLENGVRPVVVEMPDVNIRQLYGDKPLYDKMVDRIRAWLTHSPMYSVMEYSEALKSMLVRDSLMEKVVFVPVSEWNPKGCDDPRGLYLSDQIHLNERGYHLLDSCIAVCMSRQ